MLADLRFAGRMLLKAPGFTFVVVASLALGIGANTAIFSVVHTVLMKPLPYDHPDRLVMVWQDLRARGGPPDEWATPGNFFDWQAEDEVFETIAAAGGWQTSVGGTGEAEPILGAVVTRDYLAVLGVNPLLGRTFLPEEDRPEANRVVVLGHGLWTRQFGGDPSIVGRLISFAGEPHEVVGVMPRDFKPAVITAAEAWRPMRLNAENPSRGAVVLRVVGRLREGLQLASAQARLETVARRLEEQHPATNRDAGIAIVPLAEHIVGSVRLPLLVLLGAVGFILLIACLNIANLLLARASTRRREVAVRLALGAGRPGLVRLLLTESLLYALAGGALGLLVARWGIDLLLALVPQGRLPVDGVALEWPVVAFTAAVSIAAGLVFGSAPALQASSSEVAGSLKEGGPSVGSRRLGRLRPVLVAGQIAIALVLLVGAGLLARSFARLQAVDLGFDPRGVLTGYVVPPAAKYPGPEHMLAFYDMLADGVRGLPGVAVGGLSSNLPLPGGDSDISFTIEGRPAPSGPADVPVAWYRLVSPEYFRAIGMTMVSGRAFEGREPTPVVIINETMARRYWPDTNPLGARLSGDGPDGPWFTVVGVVRDVKTRGPAATPQVEMFLPYHFLPERGMEIVLRASGDAAGLTGALRRVVREIDPDVPVRNIALLEEQVAESVSQPRFLSTLLAVFAIAALSLAALGVYGVMSYTVLQRAPEIGIRMALGADRAHVVRQLLGEGVRLALAGMAAGVAAALLLVRLVTSLLFGVEPTDPLTFAFTAILLLAVALLASYVPARRAADVDPLVALRNGAG
jgi:putative ABC transport system permease protein